MFVHVYAYCWTTQVFVLQLNPQEPRMYKHILKCRFNDSDHFDQELLLSGAGEVPLLELENKVHTLLHTAAKEKVALS